MQARAKRAASRSALAHGSRSDLLLALVEDMRTRLSTIEAFTSAAAELLDKVPHSGIRSLRRDVARLSYLLDHAASIAVASVVESERKLRIAMKVP